MSDFEGKPTDTNAADNEVQTSMEEVKKEEDNFSNQGEENFEDMVEMGDLIDSSLPERKLHQIIVGEIVQLNPTHVIIDVGLKSEAIMPRDQFEGDWEIKELKEGMKIEVFLVREENRDGLPIVSRKKALEIKARQRLTQALKDGTPIVCRVTAVTKGGLQVDAGVPGFIPFSHSGVRRGDKKGLENMVGKVIETKFIEKKGKSDIILSRRLFLEEKRKRVKVEVLDKLHPGDRIKGVVRNITNFGAFVDIGGIDGLLHINDMSWQFIQKPEDMLAVGQEIETVVLKKEGEKISLGLKQKTPNPWSLVEEKYQIGQRLQGRITSLAKYGAFVELEPGIEGLIHVSEMSWVKMVKHPSEIFAVGDEVQVIILNIDTASKRISLGYKQTIPNPWENVAEKFPIGAIVQGPIVGLTEFGAFLRLEDGVDGMIHVSDMSWIQKVHRPQEILKEGDVVRAMVMEVDTENRRISLSKKSAEENPWEATKRKYQVGSSVEVEVVKITDFGVFAKLDTGVEGLAHISELSEERINHPSEVVSEGETVRMKIIKFDPVHQKISLSIQAFRDFEEKQELEKYMNNDSAGIGTMGELLSSAMKEKGMEVDGFSNSTQEEGQSEG